MAETREQLKEREKTWECPRRCTSMGICPDNCPSRLLAILEFERRDQIEKRGDHG